MRNSMPSFLFRFMYLITITAIIFFAITKFGILALLLAIITYLLITFEHPKSTSKIMADDAILIDMPISGGEGKSVVVVGGRISGLSAAKFLIQAGCDVILLERNPILGGNNTPYLENGEHHATTVIVTLPAQQPHYLQLCREYGIEQTPHDFEDLKGAIVLENRELNTNMGAGVGGFLRFINR